MRPVPHGEARAVPKPPEIVTLESENKVTKFAPSTSKDHEFEHNRITQNELNDLVRYLELLASRLQQCNLLDVNVKVSAFCSHQKRLAHFSRRKVTLSPAAMLMV
jgi:hypothetical protein